MNIIAEPFAWLLRLLYQFTSNYGVSLILFAIVVRLVLMPFQLKSKRSMMRMSRLNPRLKELEKRYEGNKEKYQVEVSNLYKSEGINPLSGCLWSLIPFPILIGLIQVIRYPITKFMGLTADQLQIIIGRLTDLGKYVAPDKVNAYYELEIANLVHQNFDALRDISDKLMNLDFTFLGMDLGKTPQWNFFLHVDWNNVQEWLPALGLFLMPVISAVLSYLQMHMTQKTSPSAGTEGANMKSMNVMMPLMSLWIGFTLPAALALYWLVGYIWAIPQEFFANRYYSKKLDAEEAERSVRFQKRDEEYEAKRKETERLRKEGLTERNPNTSKKKLQSAEKSKEEKKRAEENKSKKDILPSQVGNRKYARGRAYVPNRFDANYEIEQDSETEIDEVSQLESEIETDTQPQTIDADGHDDDDVR